MKIIVYYLLLSLLIIFTGACFLFAPMETMSMPAMLSISSLLAVYTIGISLVGETNNVDERDIAHRNISNRMALISGTAIFSVGLIYQMMVYHQVEWWLLAGLMGVNLTKIASLIYLNDKG